MRLVFAGTPEFARRGLRALIDAGHEVVGVLSQPDRPSGRGMKLLPSPVKQAALEAGIPVLQPRSLRLDGRFADEAQAAREALVAMRPEAMVVAAYGLILPQWVLDLPPLGCLNIHASLLPRWRGAAPIQRAIEAGDVVTGVTIMQMDAGLDTGDMLREVEVPIGPRDTASSLHDALAEVGARAIVEVLAEFAAGRGPRPVPQSEAGACYAEKLLKSEATLDFRQDAEQLARRIRAFDPFPGTAMALPGLEHAVKVWEAHAVPADAYAAQAEPGSILRADAQGIDVATVAGVLRITALQRAGGKRQPAAQFLQAWSPPD
ncbi:methionyl-tRNA formyltransferase [Castellaniella sp. GW247-6E4]|uniref:methionyl-tRNA formyltransferase n=1 Tax=Castellaniella sp. GW247-6E4 TaxID=3140380 RepID=UPI003315B8B4